MAKNYDEIRKGTPSFVGIDEFWNSFKSGVSNFWKKITGSGLTGAEREANEWSARQAELAFEREADFYEKNQSMAAQIAAQREAGINPFGINGSASAGPVVSSSAPSSVTPTGSQGFDPIALAMQIARYRLDKSAIDADNELKRAQANDLNTRLNWDSQSFEVNLGILNEQLKSGQLNNEQIRKHIDEMFPALKAHLESQTGLNSEQANFVYQQAVKACNEAEKVAQEVSEAKESWSYRKKSLEAQSIIDEFESSTADVVKNIGGDDSSIVGALMQLIKFLIVNRK